MQSIAELNKSDIEKLKAVLFDVDDTITNDGRLSAVAYGAMWRLYEAGYSLIPVTGRPAGWCNMMLRQWPVCAVVGENGAFVYDFNSQGGVRMIKHPLAADDPQAALLPVKQAVLKAFPKMRVADDQFARLYDIAIDFCENEPKLPIETAYAAAKLCTDMGAEAKVSSIHINAWFGGYSKADMTKIYLKEHLGIEDIEKECIFLGDSPNDEPMFKQFKLSCGVSNILSFSDKMNTLPRFVCDKPGGYGFSQAADIILAASKR